MRTRGQPDNEWAQNDQLLLRGRRLFKTPLTFWKFVFTDNCALSNRLLTLDNLRIKKKSVSEMV